MRTSAACRQIGQRMGVLRRCKAQRDVDTTFLCKVAIKDRRSFRREPTRSTIRESRTYRRHPEGPSARSFRSGPFHRSGCPRDAAARAALTATDAIAASSTMARRFPVAFQRGKCRRNTVVNCCSHSAGRNGCVTVCDAGWTRNALNVSAMKRIGPIAPSRSHKSQSAVYQSASSNPPESIAALRLNTGDGIAMKF